MCIQINNAKQKRESSPTTALIKEAFNSLEHKTRHTKTSKVCTSPKDEIGVVGESTSQTQDWAHFKLGPAITNFKLKHHKNIYVTQAPTMRCNSMLDNRLRQTICANVNINLTLSVNTKIHYENTPTANNT